MYVVTVFIAVLCVNSVSNVWINFLPAN